MKHLEFSCGHQKNSSEIWSGMGVVYFFPRTYHELHHLVAYLPPASSIIVPPSHRRNLRPLVSHLDITGTPLCKIIGKKEPFSPMISYSIEKYQLHYLAASEASRDEIVSCHGSCEYAIGEG